MMRSQLQRWQRFIERIDLSRWASPIRLEVFNADLFDAIELRVAICVPDIHTKELSWVTRRDFLPDIADDKTNVRIVRRYISLILEHEIDECLLLDGEQLRDPHANEGHSP